MAENSETRRELLESLYSLEGSAALVTGGAGGLGFAMASTLGKAGATVYLADFDRDGVHRSRDALVADGVEAHAMVVDVADIDRVGDMVTAAAASTPPLRIVVANAGISAGPGPLIDAGGLSDLVWDRWHQVLRVNLTGVMATIQAASRVLPNDGYGRIIAVSSIAGLRTESAVGFAYAASKAGVVAVVRQAAVDCARRKITVNAIAPGPFDTGLGGGRIREDALRFYFTSRTALREVAHPDDIAGLALFLASPSSRYVTGTTYTIDGGTL